MTEQTAIAIRTEMSLGDTLKLADTLARSGYFEDAKDAAQAAVKILAGAELGFGAIASMTGIHIIKSRVSVGANLMASAVKRDPRYNYRVVELTDARAEVAFYEEGQECGRSVFTAADASKAGTQNMGKFPRNMLFARAMSNGVKWFCPDVGNGQTMYTPEELGADVDDDGNIVNVTPTVITRPEPAQVTQPTEGEQGFTAHWIDGVTSGGKKVRSAFWAWTSEQGLSNAEVYQALEVEHVHDYQGTMGEAKAQIEGWIKTRSDAPADDPWADVQP